MRLGKSPTRYDISDYRPARVTLAILVSIPNQIGYYSQRLEILKLCLGSAVKHAGLPVDLLVFDNGSCPEVRQYLRKLHDQGFIQYLIFSGRNIGKIGALKVMFSAAPGEMIAYADDDIFFHPGWLSAHLKLLDAFPRAGMVSGCPVREQFKYGNPYLQEILDSTPSVAAERGHLIPDEWERDFQLSTGRNPAVETADCEDIVLHYEELSAYATATHFQFVVPKKMMMHALDSEQLIEWSGRMMGQMREMDAAVDALRYLRLSTTDRYVQHIGNLLTPDFLALARKSELVLHAKPVSQTTREHWRWLMRKGPIRTIIMRVYNATYKMLKS